MSDLSKLTAAPAPVTLGGKEYLAPPLTIFDTGILEEMCRASILRAGGLPEDEYDINSGAMAVFLGSVSGALALVMLSLSKKYPEMTRDKIGDGLLDTAGELDDAKLTIMRISGLSHLLRRGGTADTGATFPPPPSVPPADDAASGRAA